MASLLGALRFTLGADTAVFERNLKGAEASLRRVAAVGAAVGTALGAAFVGAARSITSGISSALNSADQLNKASQQIGITVEKLSALSFAADLSGVSLETLTSSMSRLSRSMQEAITNNTSTAARTFQALGISAADAAGQFRPTVEVFGDLADRFARIQDGAGKTALAMNIFGRSGAQLIPLLNQGRAGLAEATAEAERLGLVIGTNTARAAEKFNDTLRVLGRVKDGIVASMAERLLPTLQRAADMFLRWTQESQTLQVAMTILDNTIKGIISVIAVLNAAAETVIDVVKRLWEALKAISTLDFSAAGAAFAGTMTNMEERARGLALTLRDIWTETNNANAATANLGTNAPLAMAPVIASSQAVGDALRRAKDEARAALDTIINAPTETFVVKMAAIEEALRRGTITMRQFGEMTRRVQKENQEHILDLGSATATALTTIFGKNKAAAIASAIINTAVGITRALATLPPPFSWAQAALIAASGAAQLATIKSTNENGGGGAPTVSGTGGGGGDGGGGGGGGQTQMITIQGLSPDSLISGEGVRTLIDRINEAQADGKVLVNFR